VRFSNWPKLLDSYLAKCSSIPFAYGKQDCVLFAIGSAKAITGVNQDIGVEPWSNTKEAAQRLAEVDNDITVVMQWAEEIDPAYAGTGDIAMLEIDGRNSLGVFLGTRIAGPGETGLVFISRARATKAWRV